MKLSNFDIQRLLRAAGYYRGDLDGDLGPKSQAGIRSLLTSRQGEVEHGWERWSLDRQAVAAAQLVLKHSGYNPGDVDGWSGYNTAQAFGEWSDAQAGAPREPWRPDDRFETVQTPGAVRPWGLQKDVERRFGVAGGPQCTAGVVTLPFPLRLAWAKSTTIRSFRCHEAVADSVARVLGRVADAYSEEQRERLGLDLWGGCFNYRNKRGGATLSMHAYGVAIDWDPERNQLKWGRDRAALADPAADRWWSLWEEEGWLSLGRARNFDWMHVQAPGL